MATTDPKEHAMPTTRQQLADHLAAATTHQLAAVLLTLDAKDVRSDAERRSQAEIIAELCRRHPEIDESLERWAESLDDADLSQAQMTVALIPSEALDR